MDDSVVLNGVVLVGWVPVDDSTELVDNVEDIEVAVLALEDAVDPNVLERKMVDCDEDWNDVVVSLVFDEDVAPNVLD
ncbi:hypothetical protein B9Z55_022339 [Caenorhabditis nigoni]|uniref:Uncharacterized protein n=1 Tax=Caenorhabditis nigoni TaxID=1611254 RepID=A0A2G5SJS9_9PELO|nr:hypothetical protein B9Z55_022339 [Caenorhabditis nigoni]